MVELEPLVSRLRLDTSGFSGPMAGAAQQLDGFSAKMKGVGATLTGIGQKLTLGVTAPILGMAAVAVNAASDLSEAYSAVGTVFGAAANQIAGFTGSVAADLGLSREQALSAAAGLGVFADAAGLSGAEAAGFSNELVAGAADLASFYNAAGGVPEVLADIRSGLTGETEPLRKYGILLNEAALQQYALANGIWDGVGAMTEQQKVLARHGFILENLGAAEGDFARTQGGLANSTRVLKAQMTDLAATLGEVLVPYVQRAVAFFQRLAAGLQKLSPGMRRLVVIIALAAAAIGPLLVGLGLLASAIGSIGALFAAGGLLSFMAPLFAALLGPIALVAVAVGALAYLFRGDLARAVKAIGDRVGDFARRVGSLYDLFRGLGSTRIEATFAAIGAALRATTGIDLTGFFAGVGGGLQGLIDTARTFVDETVAFFGILRDRGVNPVSAAVLSLGQAFERLTGIDVSPFTTALSGAVSTWIATFDLLRTNGYGPVESGIIATGQAIEGLTGIDISPWASELGKRLEGAVTGARFLWEEFGRDAPFILAGIGLGLKQLRDDLNLWLFAVRGVTGETAQRFDLMLTAARIAWPGVRAEIQEAIGALRLLAFAVQGTTGEVAERFGAMRAAAVLALGAIEGKIGDVARMLGVLTVAADMALDALAKLTGWGDESTNTMGGGGDPSLGGAGGSGYGHAGSALGGFGFGLPITKDGADRRGMALADAPPPQAIPAPDFSAFNAAWQAAATLVTNATLAIESRITAMAGVVTAMAFNAGDGVRAGLDQGFRAAGALVTTVTLGLEARLTAFAGVVTAMGFNAGDGFAAGIGQGFQAAGAVATTITLGIEARLLAFAGEATVAGFNAGDGFAAGIAQGMARAVGAAQSGAGQIRGALTFSLAGQGYAIGASLAQGIANGIYAWAGIAAAAAANMVSGAIMAARIAGAIFSPSRTMADLVGLPLAEGVAVGLRRGLGAVEDAAAGLIAGAAGQGLPGAWAAPVPAFAHAGGAGAFGRPQQVHHHHYDFTGAVVGGDAEAWIARVSAREILPAVGKALDVERRAQGMR